MQSINFSHAVFLSSADVHDMGRSGHSHAHHRVLIMMHPSIFVPYVTVSYSTA